MIVFTSRLHWKLSYVSSPFKEGRCLSPTPLCNITIQSLPALPSFTVPYIGVTNIASTNLIDQHRVLSHENQSLDPQQKELLSWHCCWGYCGVAQCRQILSCPKQTKHAATHGVHRSQLVVPANSKMSSWAKVFCTACLYAKQGCRTPDSQTHVD